MKQTAQFYQNKIEKKKQTTSKTSNLKEITQQRMTQCINYNNGILCYVRQVQSALYDFLIYRYLRATVGHLQNMLVSVISN